MLLLPVAPPLLTNLVSSIKKEEVVVPSCPSPRPAATQKAEELTCGCPLPLRLHVLSPDRPTLPSYLSILFVCFRVCPALLSERFSKRPSSPPPPLYVFPLPSVSGGVCSLARARFHRVKEESTFFFLPSSGVWSLPTRRKVIRSPFLPLRKSHNSYGSPFLLWTPLLSDNAHHLLQPLAASITSDGYPELLHVLSPPPLMR